MPSGFLRALIGVAGWTWLLAAAPAAAQEDSRRSLDLTVNHTGISIGDSREVTGLRLNFRDTRLERVDGVNITMWSPTKGSHGTVRGVAIGAPRTGADRFSGIALNVFGIEADQTLRGVTISGIGAGAGKEMSGAHLALIGMGSGGDLRGVGIGGIGIGAGGSLRGLMVGGIGAGAGGDVRGIVVGGIGAAAGGRLDGIAVGLIGVGAGSGGRGLMFGGIGAAVGGDYDGIAIGGVGAGVGGTLRGAGFGGIGIGARAIHGVGVGGVGVGGEDLEGLFVSLITVKVAKGGEVHGLAVSGYNDARNGTQRGLMIGLVNIANELHGVQMGLVNIARRNPSGRRVLPLINWNFGTS